MEIKLLIPFCICFHISFTQTFGEDISIQLSATIQESPAQITTHWKYDNTATNYTLYRRTNSASSWGAPTANLPGTDSMYLDNSIAVGQTYEYKLLKSGSTQAYGYINTSIKLGAIDNRGVIIIVVENTYVGNTAFDNAIDLTLQNIENDGWIVKRLDVNVSDDVAAVKNSIVSIYNEDPGVTKALYLIGHVPVPYSGLLNPDGHPDHLGAWPTDNYYADIDGNWTDVSVNDNTSASSPRNHNVPGDGKFDQSINPSTLELQVGRIDFANLSTFPESEESLLIKYMNKANMYKTKQFTANERALIDDNFTAFSEGFSSGGYRNFSTMFGPANVDNTLDLRTATTADSYMWSYGCGAGSYTSCSGIGNTGDLAGDSLQTIFVALFGSYFGDWDSNNNFLRAVIAQGQTLNTFWSGRPIWSVHHMALGGNVGFSSNVTQNNTNDYFGSTLGLFKKWVHISLLGDPTVRMHYLLPPTDLILVNNNNVADLTWTASIDATIGYNIYRIEQGASAYLKLNGSPVTTTSYTDLTVPNGGIFTYVVKAVALKTTASGSYYNQSLGIRDSEVFTLSTDESTKELVILYPNPNKDGLIHVTGINMSSIEVFDHFGREVEVAYENGIIDASSLEHGQYIVKLVMNNHNTLFMQIILY
jgi:hypothetical protein